MITKKADFQFEGISLLVSSKCNLNCEFCFFKKNEAFFKYDEIIQKAWKEQTYLNTVLSVLKVLNQDLLKVNNIDIWGGESLYDLTYFIPNVKEIYKNLPNINRWWIPTNFSIHINQLIDLLLEIDKYTNQTTQIDIQLSIDGPFEVAGHKVKKEIYEKNFIEFFKTINNISFKNIYIKFLINAVIDEQVYTEYFSKDENIITYLNFMKDICSYIKNNNKNNKVLFKPDMILPKPSSPSHATVENGIQLTNILRKFKFVLKQYFPELNPNIEFFDGLKFNNLETFYAANYECKALIGTICILPDGTIGECINHYLMQNKDYQQELFQQDNITELTTTKYAEALSYNPLKMKPYELMKHLRYINEGYRNNESTYRCLSIGTCIELLKSQQIDVSYNNIEKLFNHINAIELECNCTAYNHTMTHIPYLTPPGKFRLFFNGALDYFENTVKKEQYIND